MKAYKNEEDSIAYWKRLVDAVERHAKKYDRVYMALFIVSFLYIGWNQRALSVAMEKMTKQMDEERKSVIGLTIDGRPLQLQKTQLEAGYLENTIASTLKNYFIVSRKEITKNYTIASFKTEDDILKNSERLKIAYEEFILFTDKEKIGSLPPEEAELQNKGLKAFKSYITYLLMSIADNNLPHYINTTQVNIVEFQSEKNKFFIRVQMPCVVAYIDNANRPSEGNGVNEIVADGFFDITKRTKNNPFGLKIIPRSFKIVQPKQQDQTQQVKQ